MKKWLALTVMTAGIVLLGWGIWQIASTHLQTAQSLEAAKKAVADDQRMSKKQFSPEVGKASGILTIPKLKQTFPLSKGQMRMTLPKESGITEAVITLIKRDKSSYLAIVTRYFAEQVSWILAIS
ncbi:hypothetical protein BSAF29S_04323 [Bacillus safensis subsp. safensis]